MANIGYIQVNRYCNNQCHFCSNPSNGANISYERGVELIDDFKSRNYQGIIFTGGEPTLSGDLSKWIKYAVSKNIACRVISNGMACSKIEYVQELKNAGLNLIHFSLYSFSEKIHDFLTDTPGSYRKLIKAIQNTLKMGIEVQLNCVINKYNQDHLDKTVKFVINNFPHIRHFVWNNLDPAMMRKTDIAISCLPDFGKAGVSLIKALDSLEKSGRTYRVERLPLCFMRGFEHASTETRKIIKEEERIVHFLDNRETYRELDWEHEKIEECESCDLSSVCAGIYEYYKYYNYVKVEPQKLNQEEKEYIINKVKN